MTSSRNYHHGFYQWPVFMEIVTFSMKFKLNFFENKSMRRPEREWLGIYDSQNKVEYRISASLV
jgi:hypothetical protein